MYDRSIGAETTCVILCLECVHCDTHLASVSREEKQNWDRGKEICPVIVQWRVKTKRLGKRMLLPSRRCNGIASVMLLSGKIDRAERSTAITYIRRTRAEQNIGRIAAGSARFRLVLKRFTRKRVGRQIRQHELRQAGWKPIVLPAKSMNGRMCAEQMHSGTIGIEFV